MNENIKISDESLKNATGKSWNSWLLHLDSEQALLLSHKDIVKIVAASGVENRWWQQMVTNGYEKLRKGRVLGDSETGFQVGVQRTYHVTAESMWKFLVSPAGSGIFLSVEPDLKLETGLEFVNNDGVRIGIRLINEKINLRMSWLPSGADRASSVQLRIIDKGGNCALSIAHEQLPDAEARDEMRKYWTSVHERFKKALKGHQYSSNNFLEK